jgi:diguanylate cyclase (GGDEF)-like protein
VVKLTRQENVSYAQVAQAAKADPVLVARLLKLANACRAEGSRAVLSIQDAVTVLGLTAVRGLALGFSVLNDNRSGTCRNFDYPVFWSRSLACAAAMQSIAAIARIMPRDEAFTLGLLAHIGELGLASAFSDEYSDLLAKTSFNDEARLRLEQQAFGLDHADLTAVLLEDWGIPALLIEPVRCHEKPAVASFAAGSRTERMLFVLMLASRIANICLAPEAHRRSFMADYFLLGGKLSITPEMLTELSDRVVRDWAEWCRLLDVPEKALPPFGELMNATQAPPFVNLDDVPHAIEGERFRVLIVDDERSMRGLLRALLDHIGHDCLEAENGRQGYELALRECPDLMIIDWAMPEMNGVELIRALRETGVGRGIYILILTGMDQEENLVEAFAAGADDFLAKPLKPKVLAARLRAGQRVVTLHREIEHDHTQLKRFAGEFAALNQRLQETRRTDLLTGLLTRLPALEWLRQACDSGANQTTIGLVLIQVEHLGQINRDHGRQIGDEVLRRMSATIQMELHPREKLARYSGGSFLLMCPDASKGGIDDLANKIKKNLSTLAVERSDGQVFSAVTIGCAVGPAVSSQIDTLLDAAESAMFCLER